MDSNESILARIDERLESIDCHLEKINGRLDAVEKLATLSDKAIAVITSETRHSERTQEGVNLRVANNQQRLDDRFYGFIKENGLQLGTLGTLIYLIGQNSGWW